MLDNGSKHGTIKTVVLLHNVEHFASCKQIYIDLIVMRHVIENKQLIYAAKRSDYK